MSSVHRVGWSPLLMRALVFLDPRRWVGALLATLGILISIVAAIFPSHLSKRFFPPADGMVISRRPVSLPKRSSPNHVQPITMTTSIQPRIANESHPSPHVTFAFDNHLHSFSATSLPRSSPASQSLQTESSPPPHNSDLSSSPPRLTELLPPPSPYLHPHALPSLESLESPSDPPAPPPLPTSSPSDKRPFWVPLPKLGFGRRRSNTDVNESPTSSYPNDPPSSADVGNTDSPDTRISDDEWRGTKAFAVKRNNTLTNSPKPGPEVTQPTSHARRKFSFFSRDSSSSISSKEKDSPAQPTAALPPVHPAPPPDDGGIPPVPPMPSPTTLKSMVAALPSSSNVAGPSKPRAPSPPAAPAPAPHPHPHANPGTAATPITIPLAQTTTPPARPTRTDPYKTYGVPVPGSERALTFLKAEKEWIRMERERRERERERERAARAAGGEASEQGVREPDGGGDRHGEEKGEEVENGKGREGLLRRCAGSLKKGKELPTPVPASSSTSASEGTPTAVEAPAERSGSGETHAGGDASAGRVSVEKLPVTDEFGALVDNPARQIVSASASVRPRSAQGRLGWVFTRRGVDGASGEREKEKEERRREKKGRRLSRKERDQGRDGDEDVKSAKATGRAKSRDEPRKALGFRPRSRGKAKELGYSSDSGVPSLTYKLIS